MIPHLPGYILPEDRIAQVPAERRDASRLLVMRRGGSVYQHRRFAEFACILLRGDLLVLNDSRVIPARLRGVRAPGGGAVELLLEERVSATRWRGLARPARKLREGTVLSFAGGRLGARVVAEEERGMRVVEFDGEVTSGMLEEIGEIPLPPYIRRPVEEFDRQRYQTVYAREPGAVAAPTAGLHFTPEVFGELGAAGVGVTSVTLHVGTSTFRGGLGTERYSIGEDTARLLNKARREGRRVVAVGTTTTRALETALGDGDSFRAAAGRTGLVIGPGYEFRAIDCLLTNFHLPESSPLAVACAFAGSGEVLAAYGEAISKGYRFGSYGDAMLIQEEKH